MTVSEDFKDILLQLINDMLWSFYPTFVLTRFEISPPTLHQEIFTTIYKITKINYQNAFKKAKI